MPIPGDSFSFHSAKVDVSADNESWTALSDHGAGITVTGGERITGSQHTLGSDVAIVKAGPRDPVTIEVTFVYTEIADEPYEVCRAIYETVGGACYVRYLPKGGDTDFIFTGAGVMKSLQQPQGEAGSGDPILSGFSVECPELTKGVASGAT